jgi:hypothetical protein
MKTWLVRINVGVLAILPVLVTETRVWAMMVSARGKLLALALQPAGTSVRILLGLAVAAISGVLSWLVVLVATLVAGRGWRGAELNTVQDGKRSTPE